MIEGEWKSEQLLTVELKAMPLKLLEKALKLFCLYLVHERFNLNLLSLFPGRNVYVLTNCQN